MRLLLPAAALALLTACTPPHLQPQGAVGFGDTPGYAPAAAVPAAPSTVPGASGISSSEINTALYGTATPPLSAASAPPLSVAPPLGAPLPAAVAGASPAIAPPATPLGISDEQDFKAVSARETIETDKQRIEANKANYQQIAPTALPERDTSAEVSPVIQYVLSAPNRLGESIYQRRPVKPEAYQTACQRYASDEAAQEAFLKAGGPERDGKKLDPDGDGFACAFDPTPFQKAHG